MADNKIIVQMGTRVIHWKVSDEVVSELLQTMVQYYGPALEGPNVSS